LKRNDQLLLLAGLGGLAAWLWFTKSGQAIAEAAGEVFSSEPDPTGALTLTPEQSTYDLIMRFEGFSPTAYQDVKGVWTIGYGHTGNVQPGDTRTQAQAQQDLIDDVAIAVRAVNAGVGVPLTQNQYDALVSFTYNVGNNAFLASTLLAKLNAGDYQGAADQFARWNKSGGKAVAGLTNRREAERETFLT
jgi:lysozyme